MEAISSDFLITLSLYETGGAEPNIGMSTAWMEAIYPHRLSDNFGFIQNQGRVVCYRCEHSWGDCLRLFINFGFMQNRGSGA